MVEEADVEQDLRVFRKILLAQYVSLSLSKTT